MSFDLFLFLQVRHLVISAQWVSWTKCMFSFLSEKILNSMLQERLDLEVEPGKFSILVIYRSSRWAAGQWGVYNDLPYSERWNQEVGCIILFPLDCWMGQPLLINLPWTKMSYPKPNVFQKIKVLSKFLEIVPKFFLVHEIGIIFLEGEVTVTWHFFADICH